MLEKLLTNGRIAILNDLTNCIKCGDITEQLDDRINLIEVKTSNGKNYRIIRQENKRKEIMNYLYIKWLFIAYSCEYWKYMYNTLIDIDREVYTYEYFNA